MNSRREFLRRAAETAVATALATGLPLTAQAAAATGPAPQELPDLPTASGERESLVLRMQADLRRALTKPVGERRWAMVIDLRKCSGCMACTVACKSENGLPPGVVYRPVIDEEMGEYPHVTRRFLPRPCMHCEEPPCASVCPVGATHKRPDGIVAIDYESCIGCRYCIAACPYGARSFDDGSFYTEGTPVEKQPYETAPSFEYGKARVRAEGGSPVGNVRKCQFCLHRLEAGMLPACLTTCPAVATYFGDANDPESLVHQALGSARATRLKEEQGTRPMVVYLV